MSKRYQKGFTLAELLIVVAIIGVLVAISIPIFTSQLEKSRESTDLANVRSAYAEVMTAVITEDVSSPLYVNGTYQANVVLKQKQNDWQSNDTITLAGITHSKGEGDTDNWKGVPGPNGQCTISYDFTIKNGNEIGIVLCWSGGNVSNTSVYNNDIKSAFEKLIVGQSSASFIVANSTYTYSNSTIKKINDYLSENNSNIKTWAIISTVRDSTLYNKPENKNYLFSEVDISNTSQWNEGEKIPAILQDEKGEYQVGMCSLVLQKDGNPYYYVISRDEEGRFAHSDAKFNINSVVKNDDKKKIFSNIDDAYAYYKTLSIEKK